MKKSFPEELGIVSRVWKGKIFLGIKIKCKSKLNVRFLKCHVMKAYTFSISN
jgi:hypothetical protein